MKILWLSNKVLSPEDRGATGTWLDSLARDLAQNELIALANVTIGRSRNSARQDIGSIRQWTVPFTGGHKLRNGLPSKNIVEKIKGIVEDFSPDIVHVWGTELFWGLLTARQLVGNTALLETQGIKGAIARVYHGGLTGREQLGCIGLKEILRRNTIAQGRRRFAAWGRFEREIISGHRYVTIQSPWLEAQVRAVNSECRIFHNDFALRRAFLASHAWKPIERPILFCSASYPSPFKGIHVAIRTMALLKRRFPDVELRVAGALQRPGFRRDGYMAWINREVRKLRIERNVRWLGPISGDQIAGEIRNCAAVFLPTFIEGYCLALAETMAVGAPAVVSYVGGAAQLARDEESALFFSAGDHEMAAYQLGRVLSDHDFAFRLGSRAREIALERNAQQRITSRQMEIYEEIMKPKPSHSGR